MSFIGFSLPDDWYIEESGESLILSEAKVAAEIERLTERCEAYKGQVKDGALVIEWLRNENEILRAQLDHATITGLINQQDTSQVKP